MRICIENLGLYNEGFSVFEWIDLPATSEELKRALEKIRINEEYEEIFLSDWEDCPFHVWEYSNIYELNEMAKEVSEDFDLDIYYKLVEDNYPEDMAFEICNNSEYTIYHDCQDMRDVAEQVISQSDYFYKVPALFQDYFNFEAFGRDLYYEGNFIQLDCRTFIEIFR